MPPPAPHTAIAPPPPEVALIRNVGVRHEQLQTARRFNAAKKIQRIARARLSEMDQEMAIRRLIAGTDQGPGPDLPGTVAAGGTQAIGAEDERRTVVGYVQQAPQMPEEEERYSPQEMADLINVENHAAKVEMLGTLLSHAMDGIPFHNNQVVDMDFSIRSLTYVTLRQAGPVRQRLGQIPLVSSRKAQARIFANVLTGSPLRPRPRLPSLPM